MSKLEWFGWGWLSAPLRYTLCTTEEEFNSEMDRLKLVIGRPNWTKAGHATTHTLENVDEGVVCIVCIEATADRSYNEHVALLVHEAVHIFQYMCKEWGEKKPSKEFQAYGIQRISLDLIHDFAERTHNKRATAKPRSKSRTKRVVPAVAEESGVDPTDPHTE